MIIDFFVLRFTVIILYHTFRDLSIVFQKVFCELFMNFIDFIALLSFLCCDYIISYLEAFVNINFYITLYQIWYTYSFFDFAYSIFKLNLWILQYDFVNKFWISILDLDFDFVVGFTICTYNRLILAILYSLNAYKKFKKKTWINALKCDIIYVQSRHKNAGKAHWLNT